MHAFQKEWKKNLNKNQKQRHNLKLRINLFMKTMIIIVTIKLRKQIVKLIINICLNNINLQRATIKAIKVIILILSRLTKTKGIYQFKTTHNKLDTYQFKIAIKSQNIM